MKCMDANLKHLIVAKSQELDIPLIGFASVDSWDTPLFKPWIPEEFRPRALYPEAQTVIVIGLPVFLPVLETAPSIWYHELYKTINTLLDLDAYRIAAVLNANDIPSFPLPRDGYGAISVLQEKPVAAFSHRHAAYLAGLGTFGVNNMILTEEYGPRVRFTSIFTTAWIPPDRIRADSLCTRCMRCVSSCPVHALESKDYPEGLTDKETCATRSAALSRRYIAPCGFCIKVCPVGEDRQLFSREDPGIYDEKDTRYDRHHRAWSHVRSYGGG
jgi:epoxyqueuosine reductase